MALHGEESLSLDRWRPDARRQIAKKASSETIMNHHISFIRDRHDPHRTIPQNVRAREPIAQKMRVGCPIFQARHNQQSAVPQGPTAAMAHNHWGSVKTTSNPAPLLNLKCEKAPNSQADHLWTPALLRSRRRSTHFPRCRWHKTGGTFKIEGK
jgi:hypothetical protein